MKILFVPDWMKQALEAASVPRREWVCPKSLKSTLSSQDVAFYIYLNNNMSQVVPKTIVDSMERIDFDYALQQDQDEMSDVATILMDYEINDSAPDLGTEGKCLTCDLFDENTILFTYIPQSPEQALDPAQTQLQFLDRVIRQLLVYEPFERVVRKPVVASLLQMQGGGRGMAA